MSIAILKLMNYLFSNGFGKVFQQFFKGPKFFPKLRSEKAAPMGQQPRSL
jgi:hypothetical protein